MAVSIYDKNLMSAEDQQKLQGYTDGYAAATTDADKQAFNTLATNLRAKYGYSMGGDGATYTPLQTNTNNAGINANPYTAGLKQIDTSNYLKGMQAQADAVKATAKQNYIQNMADMATTYNQNVADVNKNILQTNYDYKNDLADAYKSQYTSNQAVMQTAQNNGLASTGMGAAIQANGLAQSGQQITDLTTAKNLEQAQLEQQLNTLSANYNVSKDEALQALQNTYLQADADAYTNYFNNLLSADTTNANTINEYVLAAMGYDATAIQNLLNRQAEATNSANQYEWQYKIAQLEAENELAKLTQENTNTLEQMKLAKSLGLTS